MLILRSPLESWNNQPPKTNPVAGLDPSQLPRLWRLKGFGDSHRTEGGGVFAGRFVDVETLVV